MKGKYLLLLSLLLIGVYWQWFLPGPKVANDFPLISKTLLDSMFEIPMAWSEKGAEGLGEYAAFFLWGWPTSFISASFSRIGLSFAVIERFLLISILIFGAVGIWRLCNRFNLSNFSRVVSCLFYLINTYIILLIDGGQLSVGLAYGWFPISFIVVEKSIGGNLYQKILAGISSAVLGFFDFRFIYILLLLILLQFFYQALFVNKKDRTGWILEYIKSGIISGLIVFGLHAYWLLPLFWVPISSSTFAFFTQTSFLALGNIGHSIMLLSPHWFKNVFGNITPVRWEFIFIPILVFVAPILKRKVAGIGFWLIVAIVAIFLTKGVSEPFSNIYPWLFFNLPGFSLFRDSTKFFVLVGLSYALLLGVTTEEIGKRIKNFPLKLVFYLILIYYLLFLIRPVFLNQMTGTFSKSPFESEYKKLAATFENDKNFGRIFWIPHMTPLGYSSPIHTAEEASRLAQKRPFNIGTKGTYEIFNFLREAPFMSQIFDVSGIGYIVYPPLDPRRDDLHSDNIKYYYTFSDQLSKLPWLSRVENSPIPVWKTPKHMDKFFITPNVWWVVGSDNIYNEATKSSQLALSKNALIFVEESPGLGSAIDQISESKIVLNNKTLLDLASSFIKPTQLIFPAKQLDFEPNDSGWWKREAADLLRWRDFLQTKYGIDNLDFDLGGGWTVGERKLELRIKNKELRGNRVLLARVLESTRSGQLKFYQGNNFVGEINTKKEGNNVRWFEVGKLQKDSGELEIRSAGDINVVNALAILDRDEWLQLQNKAQSLQSRVFNFNAKNTRDEKASLTYQQINPTKYKVSIKNLSGPSFVVFSQSYDRFWKMEGQESLPVYSLLNGFRVENDGEYIVEFEVQKYIYPGLIISFITVIVTAYLLLFHKHKR